MYTREDYARSLCSLDDFYRQVVTRETVAHVVKAFGLEKLKQSFAINSHFSTFATPLHQWDILTLSIPYDLSTALRIGMNNSRPILVSVAKTAARIALGVVEYRRAESLNFAPLKCSVNGNPRFAVHFSDFEIVPNYDLSVNERYERALELSRRLGGTRYGGSDCGGAIVFQSYNTQQLEKRINEIAIEAYIQEQQTK